MKAKIISYGYVENGMPKRWGFDCLGKVAGIEYKSDGTVLYGGYTVDELNEIVSQCNYEEL